MVDDNLYNQATTTLDHGRLLFSVIIHVRADTSPSAEISLTTNRFDFIDAMVASWYYLQ